MISGRQTLGSIDQALGDERSRMDAVETRIEGLKTRLVEHQQADARDYRELAKVRVDWLAGGQLRQRIDAVEQQVLAVLQQRDRGAQELSERIQAADASRAALEAERAVQADQVDDVATAVDRAEALTQARLDADPGYQAQREAARAAERTALHADEKATNSAQELESKGESYRSDPLFMYLWQRNYGLPGYKAGPLLRWLDGKVAHLIGFADARANVARLNEIPVRLREHAQRLKAAAEHEFEALKALDTAAQQADGIPALEAQLASEQAKLDAIDARIEAAQADHQALLAQKAAYATGEDEHTRKAVEYLAAELRRDDLAELRRAVLATPFPDDDLIVHRLLQRADETRELEASLESLKQTLGQHRRRLGELEAVRTDFKRHHYDRAGSTFSDGALIATLLSSFLNGMLDRGMLWKVLQEQQRYRPQRSDPTFGSGGFGRGTVWGGGLGDIVGRRGGLGGRSGGVFGGGGLGRGGGGFRTGGGF
ncbi:MAG: hypothetical protein RLZ44_570 [Pseudomonadota bacterium]